MESRQNFVVQQGTAVRQSWSIKAQLTKEPTPHPKRWVLSPQCNKPGLETLRNSIDIRLQTECARPDTGSMTDWQVLQEVLHLP